MQFSEDEKQKRLQALKDLLSEEEEKDSEPEDREDEEGDEESEEVSETSYEQNLDPNKKIVVKGVRGMKSTPFTKKFKNMAAYEKWINSDASDDYEVYQVMNEEGYQEHFSAMFEGTELSEEARDKLKVLFEAAVGYETDRKVSEIKARLEEEMKSAIEAKEAELKEEADAYLSYVVEEWASKNEVALKQQIKLDIMESFISGLRNLFLEHNFNIPEEQTSMVDALMEKVAALEEDVKTLARKNVALSEELDLTKRQLAFKKITEGMTELDVEKLKGLVESKKFETAEEFEKGVALIKEAYFKKEATVSEEKKEEIISEQKEEIPASIRAYASMISKSVKK